MVYVNQPALQARGLTLMDVVHALNRSNLIIPAGDAKIGSTDYFVYTNSMIEHPENINDVPVKVAGPGAAQCSLAIWATPKMPRRFSRILCGSTDNARSTFPCLSKAAPTPLPSSTASKPAATHQRYSQGTET